MMNRYTVRGILIAGSVVIAELCWFPLTASDQAAREAVEALEAYAVYKMGQYGDAYQRFLVLAQKNNTQGMLNVANMLQAGLGTAVDPSAALVWYLKAADRGSAIGMFYSGKAYLLGIGTDVDLSTAQHWLHKASAAGSSEAQLELGKLLIGSGESDAGLAWIERAAQNGDIVAERYLASRSQPIAESLSLNTSERALIEAAWDSIDRSLRHRNAPGVVHYLGSDAVVKIRLPDSQNWLQLDRRGLQEFWQHTFNRVQAYSAQRANRLYRRDSDGIRVDSVIDEALKYADRTERLRVEESTLVSIRDDRVVIDRISLIITRL